MPRNNTMSTELAKKYNWNELEVTKELVEIGESLDNVVKLTGALALKENTIEIRKKLFHALSLQKKGPSEEGLSALDKGEERVSNRAANASAAADTKGITGAHKDKMIADAIAKERNLLEERAKKQQLDLEEKLKEAKRQLELAEKSKKEAEDKAIIANAAAEHQDAQQKSEAVGTRARKGTADSTKEKLEELLKRVKRKHMEGQQIEDDDFEDVEVVKRRKKEEAVEKRRQAAVEKYKLKHNISDEEANEKFEQDEIKREENRAKAAEKRKKEKEETLKEQFLPEIQAELKTEREKVGALEKTLTEIKQELREEQDFSKDKKKENKKQIKNLKVEHNEVKEEVAEEKRKNEVANKVFQLLINEHGVDKKLVKKLQKNVIEEMNALDDEEGEEGGEEEEEEGGPSEQAEVMAE